MVASLRIKPLRCLQPVFYFRPRQALAWRICAHAPVLLFFIMAKLTACGEPLDFRQVSSARTGATLRVLTMSLSMRWRRGHDYCAIDRAEWPESSGFSPSGHLSRFGRPSSRLAVADSGPLAPAQSTAKRQPARQALVGIQRTGIVADPQLWRHERSSACGKNQARDAHSNRAHAVAAHDMDCMGPEDNRRASVPQPPGAS